MSRIATPVVLVTGASRGIGHAVAMAFAAEGAQLVLVARTVGALEEMDDDIRAAGTAPDPVLVPLDLKDHDGIDRLGGALSERFGRLDVLVGNAGILGPISPLGHVGAKAWNEVMAVNVTANFRLIRSMEPLLRRSEAGRAIFVSSGAAHGGHAYWGPYSASKAALESMVRTWAAELRQTGVTVNAVNPGPMRTAMRAQAMPGEDPGTLPEPAAIAPKILAMARPAETRTGLIYHFPKDRWLSPRMPE